MGIIKKIIDFWGFKPDPYLFSWVTFGFIIGILLKIFCPLWLLILYFLIIFFINKVSFQARLFLLGSFIGIIRMWFSIALTYADLPTLTSGEASLMGFVESKAHKSYLIKVFNLSKGAKFLLKSEDNIPVNSWVSVYAEIYPNPESSFENLVGKRFFDFFHGVIGRGIINSWRVIPNSKSEDIRDKIKNKFNGQDYGVVQSVLLGDQSEIPNEVKESLNQAGIGYLLAISGLHFSIFAAIGYIIGRFLLGPILCMPYFPMQFIGRFFALIAVLLYAQIARPEWSVVRSLIMFLIGFGILGRGVNVYITCIIALFIILFIWPYAIMEMGLQLSFLSVFTLIKLKGNFIKSAITTTLATAPVILYNMGYVNVQSVVATLLCVPIFMFLIVPLSGIGLLIGFPKPLAFILIKSIGIFVRLLPIIARIIPIEIEFMITDFAIILWLFNIMVYLLLGSWRLFLTIAGVFLLICKKQSQNLILIQKGAKEFVVMEDNIIFAQDPESFFASECLRYFGAQKVLQMPISWINKQIYKVEDLFVVKKGARVAEIWSQNTKILDVTNFLADPKTVGINIQTKAIKYF